MTNQQSGKYTIYLEFNELNDFNSESELEYEEDSNDDDDEEIAFEAFRYDENEIIPLFLHRESIKGVNLYPIEIDFDPNRVDNGLLHIILIRYYSADEDLRWTIHKVYCYRRHALEECQKIINNEEYGTNEWNDIDCKLESATVYSLNIE